MSESSFSRRFAGQPPGGSVSVWPSPAAREQNLDDLSSLTMLNFRRDRSGGFSGCSDAHVVRTEARRIRQLHHGAFFDRGRRKSAASLDAEAMVVILLVYIVLLFFAVVFAYAEVLAMRSTCARERLLHQDDSKGSPSVMLKVGLYHDVARARHAAKDNKHMQLGLQLFCAGFVLEPRLTLGRMSWRCSRALSRSHRYPALALGNMWLMCSQGQVLIVAPLEQIVPVFGVLSSKQREINQLMCS